MNDFHFSSMHQPIEQLIIRPNLDPYNYLLVRLSGGSLKSHLQQVENKWNEIEQAFPFDYYFLDESLEQSYMGEQRMGSVITLFTAIALFIASIGLLGMATFNAQQRTKEMGIRKVLGAGTGQLIVKMVRQYSVWVIIANLFAWPLSWYFISRWLENFAYHTTIEWWFFGFAIITTLLLAISTVSWQAIKTANANPVDTLRYE
ncbi:MAG TPA: FtsX-like permease family protein [Bacteroidales bacterium]|nr:FtsX-like permease family protein [Bacteroidales bacterium]